MVQFMRMNKPYGFEKHIRTVYNDRGCLFASLLESYGHKYPILCEYNGYNS